MFLFPASHFRQRFHDVLRKKNLSPPPTHTLFRFFSILILSLSAASTVCDTVADCSVVHLSLFACMFAFRCESLCVCLFVLMRFIHSICTGYTSAHVKYESIKFGQRLSGDWCTYRKLLSQELRHLHIQSRPSLLKLHVCMHDTVTHKRTSIHENLASGVCVPTHDQRSVANLCPVICSTVRRATTNSRSSC